MSRGSLSPGVFMVAPRWRLESHGVILSETLHAGGVRHAMHGHASAYFDMVLCGAHREEFRGGAFELARLSVAYRPAGWEHRNRVSEAGTRCFNVELGREWLVRHGLEWRLPTVPFETEDGRIADAMRRLDRELQAPDAFSALAIDGIAVELVAACLRSRFRPRHDAPPRWLAAAREMALAPTPPPLGAMASTLGVDPSHLARTFRRNFGCSVGEMARAERVRVASELIRTGNRPLSEIALAAGFCDQAHLTRVMRRSLGTTPGRLRRNTSRRR